MLKTILKVWWSFLKCLFNLLMNQWLIKLLWCFNLRNESKTLDLKNDLMYFGNLDSWQKLRKYLLNNND